jgi:hypothetical protein
MCPHTSLYLCPHITMHTGIRAHAGPGVGGVPEKEKREKKRIPQVVAYGQRGAAALGAQNKYIELCVSICTFVLVKQVN